MTSRALTSGTPSAAAALRSALAPLSGLTTRGRCLLSAGAALLVSSVVLGQRDLLRAALFLVALPLVAVAVVARTRYRLTCSRSLAPARVQAGLPAEVRLRLDNVSRLPSGVLLMEDTLPWSLGGRPRFVLDRVEPDGVRDVSYAVRSDARGHYRIGPLQVRLTDPFGLCELARAFASTSTLVVTPVVEPLPAVRLGGDWAGGGEGSARAVAASGSDDTTTREYRNGDDLRKVHWRSTARTGELMVRREEQPFQSRATLLLDTRGRVHHGNGPGSSFEVAVSAVASVGVALARRGFALRLETDADAAVLPPGVPVTEGLLLDALAETAPSDAWDLTACLQRLQRRGVEGVLVAVLGPVDTADAERLARLRQGSSGCVAVLVDTATWAVGGARRTAQGTDAAAGLLTAAGWRVLRLPQGAALGPLWGLVGSRANGAGGAGVPASGGPASGAPASSPDAAAVPA